MTASALEEAAKGLLFVSERDAPFEIMDAPDIPFAKLDDAQIRQLAGKSRADEIETTTVEYFFRNTVSDPRYRKLISLLPKDATVFRVGRIQVSALILGTGPGGGTLGLSTTLIET